MGTHIALIRPKEVCGEAMNLNTFTIIISYHAESVRECQDIRDLERRG